MEAILEITGDDTKKLYAGLLDCPTGSIANVNRNIPARIAAPANFMREHNAEVGRMRAWAHELDAILKEGPPAVRIPTRDLIAIIQSRVAKRLTVSDGRTSTKLVESTVQYK